MISSKKAGFLVVVLGLLVPLAAAASDSGSCVASMSASLDSAVLILSAGGEETVISSPVALTFVADDGELKAVVTITPASAGPFDSVRVTLSNIAFGIFGPGGLATVAGNPSTLTDLVIVFDEDDEDDDSEELVAGQPASLELEFEPEDGLEPDGAGCFTGNFVADPAEAFEAELEDDPNEEEDLELAGAVVSVDTSSNTFVLDVAGVQHTITVNAATEFEHLTGLSDLEVGDLVKAEVEVQFDGTNLAEEVELLFDEDDDDGATGRIAGVDPPSGPATSFQLVFQPSNRDHDFPTITLLVNLSGGTTYRVNEGDLDTTGFAFDASNLAIGQRVSVKGMPVSGASPELNATRLTLKIEEVEGMLVDGSVNTTTGTFQLNLTGPTGSILPGPITVKTDLKTRFSGGLRDLTSLNTTDTYRVKGLLMRDPAGSDATDVIFIAKNIKRQHGGGGSGGM